MGKETIGGFIAALRKAHGMTQKELADRLNVSDKTVSRWERNDGYPDLSVIPVLAEIFGVTCDELLRGERKSMGERSESDESMESTSKGEKERQRLLKSTLSRYRTHTYIAMGISAVGLVVALICNLAALKAMLGLLLGCIFFIASIVCQAVFRIRALAGVEDANLDEAELSDFKRRVYWLAETSIGFTVCLLGFIAPFGLVDAFMGLGTGSMLLLGIPSAALFLLIYAIVCWLLNGSHLRRGVYALSETDAQKYWHNHTLKRKCVVWGAVVFACTLAFHALGAEILWSVTNLTPSTTFEDYDRFKAYMEKDVRPEYAGSGNVPLPTLPASDDTGAGHREDGHDVAEDDVAEDDARKEKLVDPNGDVVCEYILRNDDVAYLQYSDNDDTLLPITVVTHSDLRVGRAKHDAFNMVYGALYPLELAAIFLIYFKKRMM